MRTLQAEQLLLCLLELVFLFFECLMKVGALVLKPVSVNTLAYCFLRFLTGDAVFKAG